MYVLLDIRLVTARKRSLGQGNIFTPVCHSVHRGWVLPPGGGGASSQGVVLPPEGVLPLGGASFGGGVRACAPSQKPPMDLVSF